MGRKRGAKGRRRMYVTSAEQLEKRNQDVAMRDEQRKARRRAKGVGSSEEDSSDDGESNGG